MNLNHPGPQQAENVKPALTAKARRSRRRPVVENDEYAAFLRRVLRAYVRRIGQGDIDALSDLAALEIEIDHMLHTAVTSLRACGYSWADIGNATAVTRQAAHQRWGGERR
ncbi:hypothetical protein [Actinomadura rupiterrae]|uniref:hypothetical protein n=1 Tax=Actinomadura rupiterrae TaxID=559627 RepID=UPI0020A41304|nr:hypothetical protein [Actinomadura rupiterrae]MCP2341019.1 hypothetical protein [Actinomadura rupiterrae]